MKLLTTEEYQATLFPKMINVSDCPEEIIDLWAYADVIIERDYHNCSAWDWKVGHVYESPDRKYQHIGIPVPEDNTYLIVIADKTKKVVHGHYILKL